MFPKSEKDFYISEPLGDLLFGCAPSVYYVVVEGIDFPNKVCVRKMPAGADFRKALFGYFSQGKYRLSFKFDDIELYDFEFGYKWSFSKEDLIEIAQSHIYFEKIDVIDETGE